MICFLNDFLILHLVLSTSDVSFFISMVCQISYFEFLLAPGISIPHSLPRLPIWTSNLLNSYMALDALHGSSNHFGRLPVCYLSLLFEM